VRAWLPAVALVVASCARVPAGPDLLLVTIDTLRPDLLGCYGHDRPTTPTLDELAGRGVLFERAYSASPMTAPSHASLFSGLWPSEHGLLRNGRLFDESNPTLAASFARAGYRTAAVIGARVLEHEFGFARGFERFDDEMGTDPKSVERSAREVVDSAIEVIEDSDRRPLFLWVHCYDPHSPYEPPPLTRDLGPTAALGPRVWPSEEFRRRDLIERWRDYEAEIAGVDDQLARLLEAFEAGPRERIIAITSDHGEGLGDHDYLEHGKHLWEEQLRVPLLLSGPGLEPGARVAAPVGLVDLAATLAALAGIEADELAGRPWPIAGGPQPRPTLFAERPLFPVRDDNWRGRALLREESLEPQTAVITDEHKLIWRQDRAPLLFDLAADPREREDRAGVAGDALRELESRRLAWLASLTEGAAAAERSDDDTLRMLETLGYR
jgi:arylsulfatase A-like enzyme